MQHGWSSNHQQLLVLASFPGMYYAEREGNSLLCLQWDTTQAAKVVTASNENLCGSLYVKLSGSMNMPIFTEGLYGFNNVIYLKPHGLTATQYTYPFIIHRIDVESSVNKIFHYVQLAFFSSYIQSSSLVERYIQNTQLKN